MKKMKLLLIGFVITMFALCGCSKEKVNQNNDLQNSPEQVALTNMEYVASVQYTDNTTTITLVEEEGLWYFEGDMETWVDQTKAYKIVEAASQLTSIDVIDDEGALADYELETPAYTVIVKDAEGKAVTIYIGKSLEDGNYYATIDDKKEVYVISEELVGALQFNKELLVEIVEEEYTDGEYIEEGDIEEEYIEEDIVEEYIEEESEVDEDIPEEDIVEDSTESEE